jgi:hypothetical protein
MSRFLMVVLSAMVIASFSAVTYGTIGDQTPDRIQARDGTGVHADCPCDGVCDGVNCVCPGCPDCDAAALDAAMDQDQTQAQDGTGDNCACPTGGVCDGTGPYGPRAGR